MAVKISALPASAAATAGDQYEINQGGVSLRQTNAQTFALLQTTAGLVFTQPITFNGTITLGANQIVLNPASATINVGDQLSSVGTVNVYDSAGNLAGSLSGAIASRVKAYNGDIEVQALGNSGYVLDSPNGARWRITVDNTGQLSVNAA